MMARSKGLRSLDGAVYNITWSRVITVNVNTLISRKRKKKEKKILFPDQRRQITRGTR